MIDTHKGLFVVFEGGEGSGKTTQARMLVDALELHEVHTHLTREPGDTPLGKDLRNLLLNRNGEPMTQKAEALLFAADRAEHVETVIKPKLEQGAVVVCDRYIASTMAYQVHAGGLRKSIVEEISEWASDGLDADITFFLNVRPEVGLERAKRHEQTRFEDKDLFYHEKVRAGFLNQVNDSWVLVDGNQSIEAQHAKILDHVLHVLCVLERFKTGISSFVRKKVSSNWSNAKQPGTNPYCQLCEFQMKLSDKQPGDGRVLYNCENCRDSVSIPEVTPNVAPKIEPMDMSAHVQPLTTCGIAGCIDHKA